MSITNIQSLVVKIGADINGAVSGLNKVALATKRLGRDMARVGRTMSAAVTLPILGAAGATIKFASDAEEMKGKFTAVFRENSAAVEKWAKDFGGAVNRSRFDLMEMASSVQDTFVPLGFARGEASKMSTALTELAVDVASFNNASEPETMALFTSALVGNHEAVRRFGIVITESTLKQEMARIGADKLTGSALEQAKVQARLNLIMAATTDAQGDAERTSESFANQMRGLQADLKDVAITIGTALMPYARALVAWAKEALASFQALTPKTKAFLVVAAAIAAAIGPALVALGFMSIGLGSLATAFSLMSKVAVTAMTVVLKTVVKTLVLMTSPITLVVTAIVAVGAAFILFKNTTVTAVTGAWKVIKLYLQDRFNKISAGFRLAIDNLGRGWERFKSLFDSDTYVRPKKSFADFLEKDLVGDIDAAVEATNEATKKAFNADKANILEGLSDLGKRASNLLGKLGLGTINVSAFEDDFHKLEQSFSATTDNMTSTAATAGNDIGDALTSGIDEAKNASEQAYNDVERSLADFATSGKLSIKGMIDSIVSEFARLQIIKPFLSALGFGSGSFLGLFGGAVGAKASGGRIQPGVPTLVNERGNVPEIITVDRPSTVMNGHDSRMASKERGGMVIQVDARGAGDPAAVEAAINRAIMAAAPIISAAASQRTISSLRRPGFA